MFFKNETISVCIYVIQLIFLIALLQFGSLRMLWRYSIGGITQWLYKIKHIIILTDDRL